jgi:transcriptional regulator with XRE-family HTH domain
MAIDNTTELLTRLGAELRHARMKSGRTQADVAAAAGLARPTITRLDLERGHNGELSAVLAAAHVLGYHLSLVHNESSPEQGSFALG